MKSNRGRMTMTAHEDPDTCTLGEIARRDLETGNGSAEWLAWCAKRVAA